MSNKRSFFYGWVIVPVGFLLYGFGISPAYYSWGQFDGALEQDLGLSRFEVNLPWGIFAFVYSVVAPLVALAQTRFGLRAVITCGAGMCALGFWLMSRADSLFDCIFAFAVIGALGIGFSTILPCQTLGQNWFLKYRARAIAIILTAGAVVGQAVPRIDRWFLENRSWQDGWTLVAGISAALAVIAWIFVRQTPESIGQLPDGATAADPPAKSNRTRDGEAAPPTVEESAIESQWTAVQAIRSPQFFLIVLCGLAYALPWGVIVGNGRHHLSLMGLPTASISAVFSWMILVSIAGRLSGSLGDWMKPTHVLAVALFVEALGTGGLVIVGDSQVMAYVCMTMIGIGFGAGYISVPVVFSNFYGRRAFAATSGARISIAATFLLITPPIVGKIFDLSGSYDPSLLGLMILGVVGAACALFCPHPGLPPEIQPDTATPAQAES